jgi:hypothetical protein
MQRRASAISSSRQVRPIGSEATYLYENAAALSTGGALDIDALDLR